MPVRPGLEDYKQALTRKTVVLVELEEIVKAFTVDHPVATLIRSKIREATLEKRPLTRPLDE